MKHGSVQYVALVQNSHLCCSYVHQCNMGNRLSLQQHNDIICPSQLPCSIKSACALNATGQTTILVLLAESLGQIDIAVGLETNF